MSASDWTFTTDSLSGATVDRGVTAGLTPPNGGGSFVFGMNSLANSTGVVALYTNQANFAPLAKGCSITGCLERYVSGGPTNFSPFLFCGLQGTAGAGLAYMLGLSDADPHHIILAKAPLTQGVVDAAIGVSGVLAVSTATFAVATWLQLRLDAIANPNGDVVLNVYQSDLTAHACSSPVWAAIPGMPQVIDDTLHIRTGSAPLTSGYAGFGAQFANVTRRAVFDQITISRQL